MIKNWVKLFPEDFNDVNMRILLSNWKMPNKVDYKDFVPVLSKLNKPIPSEVSLTESQMNRMKEILKTSRISEDVILKLLSDVPQYLAQQFTLIDFDYLKRLSKRDLLLFSQNPKFNLSMIRVIRYNWNLVIMI